MDSIIWPITFYLYIAQAEDYIIVIMILDEFMQPRYQHSSC